MNIKLLNTFYPNYMARYTKFLARYTKFLNYLREGSKYISYTT